MTNLKFKTVLFTISSFFLIKNSFAQSQILSKLMYWNGEDLELIYADIDKNNGKLKELHYQKNSSADKVKLELKKKNAEPAHVPKWTATNPKTKETFEVSYLMTIAFSYPNGQEKEFLYAMEYINGDEKIIMGSMPILGDIIYQKGNNKPELWLEGADLKCKAGERNGNTSFLCEFTTAKGENLRLMIDQMGKQATLWRNGEMISFREEK